MSENKRKRKEPPATKRARTGDGDGGGGGAKRSRVSDRAMTANEEVAAMTGRDVLTADAELDEWDIGEYYKHARLMVVLGKRNTGKTVFATNFCYAHRAVYPYALVITRTKFNGYWQQYFPAHLIVDHFDPELINKFFEAQKDRVVKRGVNSRVLIIFDDMAADTALRYSEQLSTIAYNGRHYNADVLFLTQDVVKATTAMRRNADNFAILTMTGHSSVDHIYKEFASVDFLNFAHFQGLLMRTTEDYGLLIVDNNDPNLRGRDRFKKFKAKPELPMFEMCCPAAWGARDAAHRSQIANEQRKKFPQMKKYSASYTKALKNKYETQISHQQLAGQTQNQQQNRQTTSSVFSHLATRYGGD